MKRLALVAFLLIAMMSCQEGKHTKIKASSTGRFNELLVVIPQSEWMGYTGLELKSVLTADVIGLPQPEPQFSIIQIEPQQFNDLLTRTRNVLIVKNGTANSFEIKKDVYAAPQVIITLIATDQDAMLKLINDHARELVETYKKSDMAALRRDPAYKPYDVNSIHFFEKQNLSIRVPSNFEIVDDRDDFVWFRDETYDPGKNINGSKNVIAYTLPLEVPFDEIKDSIPAIRNEIGKKYIPGPREGTYMITEAAYTPHIFSTTLNNKPAYRTLGKWEIYNSFMAGPFVSYTVEDKAHNRLVVVEGFVYAPMVNKRDFVFELEAIISTLKINN